MVKNPSASAEDIRDMGSIPELRRYPVGGHGDPLQYSCLENPMGRGWATVHRVEKSWIQLKGHSSHTNMIFSVKRTVANRPLVMQWWHLVPSLHGK